jgi:hypothetical protein
MVIFFQQNVEHIHGDVEATNVTEATTPLDDAACSASFDSSVLPTAVVRSIYKNGVCVSSYVEYSNKDKMPQESIELLENLAVCTRLDIPLDQYLAQQHIEHC